MLPETIDVLCECNSSDCVMQITVPFAVAQRVIGSDDLVLMSASCVTTLAPADVLAEEYDGFVICWDTGGLLPTPEDKAKFLQLLEKLC